MINDSHIHVGQFYETYTSPQDLSLLMKRLEVDGYAVSSTTVCEKNFSKVLQEIQKLIDIDGDRVVPILWLSPEIFLDELLRDTFLNCGIHWKALKIHPDWQPYVWSDVSNQRNLLDLADRIDVPILIHTGGHEYSACSIWEEVIRNHPEQKFILAHCRPFDKAISIIEKYDNAYGDLAFVDSADFIKLHNSRSCDRILWGSDFPIVSHYINTDLRDYYEQRLIELKVAVGDSRFEQITQDNFNDLFYR